MWPRLRAFALGVAWAAGCATAPRQAPVASPAPPAVEAPAPAPAPAPTVSRLVGLARQIDATLATPTFARASVALLAKSLTTGETVYARNGQMWLVPASTTKVLTAIGAAERLGWGFRFETRLVAMGPVAGGVLDGDLLVVGTGDPTINRRHPDRVDALDAWARSLRARGIRRVAGHVIGDDRHVEAPGWGIGWAWDDLVEDYGAGVSALQYNENVVTITMGPGLTPGAPPVVYSSPSNHELLIDVQAVTGAAASTPSLSLFRAPGTRILEVRGRAPVDGPPMSTSVAVAKPALYFAGELRQALLRHGIAVDGAAIAVGDESDTPRASDGTLLLVDQSAPLVEIVEQMLAWSINLHAESLVVALDRTAPTSTADGIEALREVLDSLGVPKSSYHLRDGSGLSRNDYVSAEALVAALEAAWRSPTLRAPLMQTLPGSNRDGTFGGRLDGTAGAGRVRAKTGSMSNVRSLAGYVETLAGEPVAFAFLTNGFDVSGREIDRRVDEILSALVALRAP